MRPFLGIDITEDQKNEQQNGKEFLSAEPSAAMSAALDTSSERAINMIAQSKLPLFIRVLHWICGAVGGIILLGILKAVTGADRVSFAEAYQNAGWLFWLGGICLVAWQALKIVSRRKEKCVMESDESDAILSNWNTIADTIFAELDVPADAQTVDLLSFTYKIKNGMAVARTRGMDVTPYHNMEYRMFTDHEALHIANVEGRYSFPRSSFRAIRTVTKGIWIPVWNKETAPNQEPYKQFKLSTNNYGHLHVKQHYILELDYLGESWGIYFPNYELSAFEAMTGLHAE